jgi:hypothetical protein
MKIILKEVWQHNDTRATSKLFLAGDVAEIVKEVKKPGEISEDTFASMKGAIKYEEVKDGGK